TSSLSGTRSNQLSYEPANICWAGDFMTACESVNHETGILRAETEFCDNHAACQRYFMTPDSSDNATSGDRLWEVPYPRNPHFVGRENYLTSLRKQFIADAVAGKHQVLSGLGGIGKSQIALEYAQRNRSHYTLVWWLGAEDPTALGLAYSRLARALG